MEVVPIILWILTSFMSRPPVLPFDDLSSSLSKCACRRAKTTVTVDFSFFRKSLRSDFLRGFVNPWSGAISKAFVFDDSLLAHLLGSATFGIRGRPSRVSIVSRWRCLGFVL